MSFPSSSNLSNTDSSEQTKQSKYEDFSLNPTYLYFRFFNTANGKNYDRKRVYTISNMIKCREILKTIALKNEINMGFCSMTFEVDMSAKVILYENIQFTKLSETIYNSIINTDIDTGDIDVMLTGIAVNFFVSGVNLRKYDFCSFEDKIDIELVKNITKDNTTEIYYLTNNLGILSTKVPEVFKKRAKSVKFEGSTTTTVIKILGSLMLLSSSIIAISYLLGSRSTRKLLK